MTDAEKEVVIRDAGWSQWYNPNYWVHKKTVKDQSIQDHTNYGMNLDQAYEFETENKEPFKGQFLGHMGGLRW